MTEVVYLPGDPVQRLSQRAGYSVEVTNAGVTVYSECCADTMSAETAAALYEALGRFLADRDAAVIAERERPA